MLLQSAVDALTKALLGVVESGVCVTFYTIILTIKAVFELAENCFRKSFSVKPTRLAATENRFSGK